MNVESVPATIPDDIESPSGKLVFLYLQVSGSADVDELTETLNLTGLTAFSVLQALQDRDLVVREDNRYVPVGSA